MVRVHARRHEQSRCDWDHSVDSGLFLLCRFPRKPDRSPALRSDDGVSGNGELQPLSGSPLYLLCDSYAVRGNGAFHESYRPVDARSEEPTSEPPSIMRMTYTVF